QGVAPDDTERLTEDWPDSQFAQRLPVVSGDMVLQISAQKVAVDPPASDPELQQGVDQPVRVLAGHGEEHVHQQLLRVVINRAHHAKVDETDATISLDEEVARVRIGVEE